MTEKEILKTLNEKEKVVIIRKTILPDVDARVTINRKDGKIKLTAYPLEAGTGTRIFGYKSASLTARKGENLEQCIRGVCGRMVKRIKPAAGGVQSVRPKSRGRISGLLRDCEELRGEENPFGWSASTFKQAAAYLTHSIAPLMDGCGDCITPEDMEDIKSALVERAFNSKRTKYNSDGTKNAKLLPKTQINVNNQFKRAEKLYKYICGRHPDWGLPNVEFPISQSIKAPGREQIKALPDEVRIRQLALIRRLVEAGVSLALGIAMMLLAGLRTAESAAVTLGNIIRLGDGRGQYRVRAQVNDRCEYVKKLKSDAAYRDVPLVRELMELIEIRVSQLEAMGFSREKIEEMPLVGAPDDPGKLIRPQMLSDFGLRLLELSGCAEQYIDSMRGLMYFEPDAEAGGLVSTELAAYINRRDFASRAINHCGLSPDETDALLGHQNGKNKGRDFKTADIMLELAEKLERYVFDPRSSGNPAFCAAVVSAASEGELRENIRHMIAAGENVRLTIDVTSLEPDDDIIIRCPGEVSVLKKSQFSVKDKNENRVGRPILGALHPVGYYIGLIHEAEETDLSSIIQKYGGGS